MNEYPSVELASDSEDPKKLRAAENRALSKSKTATRFCKPNQTSTISNTQNHPEPFLGRPFFGRDDTTTSGRFQKIAKPTDMCLGCGSRCHWRRYCLHGNPSAFQKGKE